MTPPMIDLTDPDAVKREVLDTDAAVRAEFAAHLDGELTQLTEALATCFRLLPALNAAANQAGEKRPVLVAAFAFGVLDDLVVSTKLLFAGKLPAAGNLMRQVVEGIAMSILRSTNELLIIKRGKDGNPPVMARYWQKVDEGDKRTQGYLAVDQLGLNASALGVNADAAKRLVVAKQHYNAFSHCGTFTIANRLSLDEVGTAYVGGHFDRAKLDGYRNEMNERIGLCRVLPPFMERLLATMPMRAAISAALAQSAEQA
ncbi:hypothetical protein CIW54_22860 [Paraburkholderia sp. T12-10]|nr:hypothetical protein CIW54_22860 [Paraburkholderia sp. T12-10]